MFISRELHSGMARSDKISFNSLSGLFTLGKGAKKSGGGGERMGGGVCVCVGGSSADTLQPTAATA